MLEQALDQSKPTVDKDEGYKRLVKCLSIDEI